MGRLCLEADNRFQGALSPHLMSGDRVLSLTESWTCYTVAENVFIWAVGIQHLSNCAGYKYPYQSTYFCYCIT